MEDWFESHYIANFLNLNVTLFNADPSSNIILKLYSVCAFKLW